MREINISPVQTVERVFKILNCFTFEEPELSIDQIVKETGISKSTVYRSLWTMEREGVIQYNKRENKYRFGFKIIEYGGIALQQIDIRKEAEEILANIHKELGHTILLAVNDDNKLLYLLNFEGEDDFTTNSYVGKRRVLHYGPIGHVLMAYLPRHEVKKILEEYPLEKRTAYTLIDEQLFYQRLDKIAEEEYFIDVDETFVGMTGIAMPIFGAKKDVIAAIGIVGPTSKINEKKERIISLFKQATYKISRNLAGYGNYR